MQFPIVNRFANLVTIVVLIFSVPMATSCSPDPLNSVSLVKLLVKPGEYAGTQVRVVGFLQLDPVLKFYLTRDHAKALDGQSALVVIDDSTDGSLTKSNCIGAYVRIDGKFKRLKEGHWALVQVEKIIKLDDISTCWKRT